MRLALLGTFLLILAGCWHRKSVDELNRQILDAARNGDSDLIIRLLRDGANLEARDQTGSTPLALAVDFGHPQTAELLLAKGASMAGADLTRDDAFVDAARSGLVHRTEFLLKRNSTPRLATEALFALAMFAPALVKIAVDPKALPAPQGRMPPISTSQTIDLLLANGASIEARDVDGATPLIRAAGVGNLDAVKVLLDRGANLEAKDGNGRTALISAACECASIDMPETVDVLKLLVAKKAHVNAKDKEGETALMAAAGSGETSNVLFLLDSRAQIDAKGHDGNTALMLAAAAGPYNAVRALETTDAVKLLLSRGADPNVRNKHGQTALDLAVKSGRKAVAALLRNATKH